MRANAGLPKQAVAPDSPAFPEATTLLRALILLEGQAEGTVEIFPGFQDLRGRTIERYILTGNRSERIGFHEQ